MKFLMLGLEVEEVLSPFVVNIDKIILVVDDEIGDEWCLKLVIEDGFEYYCTHLLNKKGNFVNISSMSSFHSYLKGL